MKLFFTFSVFFLGLWSNIYPVEVFHLLFESLMREVISCTFWNAEGSLLWFFVYVCVFASVCTCVIVSLRYHYIHKFNFNPWL